MLIREAVHVDTCYKIYGNGYDMQIALLPARYRPDAMCYN